MFVVGMFVPMLQDFFFFLEMSETPPNQFFIRCFIFILVKNSEICRIFVCKLSFRVSIFFDSTRAIDLNLLIV